MFVGPRRTFLSLVFILIPHSVSTLSIHTGRAIGIIVAQALQNLPVTVPVPRPQV
jgi:hypothetical protein